jgi:DNA helicase-2/ATP-dependent DNA helicase PcrA
MPIQDRPLQDDFQDEEKRLFEVLQFMAAEIQRLTGMSPATAAHQQTASRLQEHLDTGVARLTEAYPNPYFGRIDFSRDSTGQMLQYYIGKYHVPGRVFSWQAPIAALYYQPAQRGYRVRDQYITGRVELKRQIEIADSRLVSIADIYRLPAPGRAPVLPANNPVLDRALSALSEGELQEVIETIQPEQYEQIAAVEKPVLIIQGSAGSGKSLIGLHRLAYLLSPFNELPEETRPRANRVLMLGPTQAFLKYVRNLLPSLTGQEIRQTTVQTWLLESFSQRPRFDRANKLFTKLMSNVGRVTPEEHQAEAFKGSLQMASLLDRHVKALRDRAIGAATRIEVQQPGGQQVSVAAAEVVRTARSTSSSPLNHSRVRFVDQIMRDLWTRRLADGTTSSSRDFDIAVRPQVEGQVARFWPVLDFCDEYVRLLSSPAEALASSRGSLTPELAESLARSIPEDGGGPFIETDLAPLLYLDHLLNDQPTQGLEHVVIDEAQDISPLEVALLKHHSRNGWFTILGDVRQRLLPYRGVTNWRQMSVVFEQKDVARYESRLSYRSTSEVTRFSNRLLRRLPGSLAPPLPYDRHGDPVRFRGARSFEAMVANIASEIRDLQAKDIRSIAVLTKWTRDAKAIARQLPHAGVHGAALLEGSGVIEGDITVAPVLLTKGLEFDAVIVAGVHTSNFSASDFDCRLLYLACTRAKHALSLHWFGKPAQVLVALGVGNTAHDGEGP